MSSLKFIASRNTAKSKNQHLGGIAKKFARKININTPGPNSYNIPTTFDFSKKYNER